jgi:hypothetical protein
MKRLLVGLVFCLFLIHVQAQVSSDAYVLEWKSGSIYFKSGDTLACPVRYNHAASEGVLQVLEKDVVITLNPEDVDAFSFFDTRKMKERKFHSITIRKDAGQEHSFFMENLYSDNRFSIVNHRTMDVPYGYQNYTRLISKPVRISKKYVLDASTGELLPLSKENVLRLMNPKRQEVTDYIQSHRLRFKKTADYIDLFSYHSSL